DQVFHHLADVHAGREPDARKERSHAASSWVNAQSLRRASCAVIESIGVSTSKLDATPTDRLDAAAQATPASRPNAGQKGAPPLQRWGTRIVDRTIASSKLRTSEFEPTKKPAGAQASAGGPDS